MKKTLPEKSKDKAAFPSLHNWNVWLAGLHALQGALILLFSATKLFPVHTSYLTADPVATELAGNPIASTASRYLFDINGAYLVAVLFFIAAIMHMAAATYLRGQYEADLKKRTNRLRWVGFSILNGVLLVLLAMLAGVVELSVLIAVFSLSSLAGMALLAIDIYNQGKQSLHNLSACIILKAAIIPWILVAVYIWGSTVYGRGAAPGYVFGVLATALVLMVAGAANAVLQYKKQGKWQDFLYGERLFMILGLLLTTAIGWQVFLGALQP